MRHISILCLEICMSENMLAFLLPVSRNFQCENKIVVMLSPNLHEILFKCTVFLDNLHLQVIPSFLVVKTKCTTAVVSLFTYFCKDFFIWWAIRLQKEQHVHHPLSSNCMNHLSENSPPVQFSWRYIRKHISYNIFSLPSKTTYFNRSCTCRARYRRADGKDESQNYTNNYNHFDATFCFKFFQILIL